MGLGFAGDLAGDLVVTREVCGLGEDARGLRDLVALGPPRAPFCVVTITGSLLSRLDGGGESWPSLSSSDSTMGCFRAARGLPIPHQQ